MAYQFEQLEVWSLALEYTDQIYGIAEALPDPERYGLASQMREAANSIALNIAVCNYFLPSVGAPNTPQA